MVFPCHGGSSPLSKVKLCDWGIYTTLIRWVPRGTGTRKDRDEVNLSHSRREVSDCDGKFVYYETKEGVLSDRKVFYLGFPFEGLLCNSPIVVREHVTIPRLSVVILKRSKRMRKEKNRPWPRPGGLRWRSQVRGSRKNAGQVRSQVRGSRKNAGQVRSQVRGSQRPETWPVTSQVTTSVEDSSLRTGELRMKKNFAATLTLWTSGGRYKEE